MGRLLAFLGGDATRVLFFGVFIGLLLPPLSALFRPLLAPAVLVLLLAMLLRVDWRAIAERLRRPLQVALLGAAVLLASPLLVWLVLAPLDLPPALYAALVLMAAAPPILSAISFTVFLGLDSALAVVVAVLCPLLAPLSLPPLVLALIGLDLDIAVLDLMIRMAAIVIGAFVGAAVVRRLAGAEAIAARAAQIDGAIVIVLLVFAIAIMAGVTASLLARPATVLAWLLAAFVANGALQLAGGLLFAPLGCRLALTAGLLLGNRNMGLLLAALPAGSDPDIGLFLAVGQIPIYTLPALTLPIYRKLLRPQKGKPSDGV